MQPGDGLAHSAGAVHGFANWSLARAPAHKQDLALVWSVGLGLREIPCQLAQFVAALGRHCGVKLWGTGWMAQLVVFQTGHDRIFATGDSSARCNVASDSIADGKIVGLV